MDFSFAKTGPKLFVRDIFWGRSYVMYSPIFLTEAIFVWQYFKKILPITTPVWAAKPLQKGAVDLLHTISFYNNAYRKTVSACHIAL